LFKRPDPWYRPGQRRRFAIVASIRPHAAFLEISNMADNGNGANNEALPQLNVLAQYTKDLSFENPNAPQSLGPQEQAPAINIQVNVNAKQLAEGEFEVELVLEGSAQAKDSVLFKFELNYAGVFRLRNIPEAELSAVIMIECPRLLFPFARQIIADNVRNGGFPPLFIDPIDFVALYRQRLAQMQAANATPA
jgi:preprotein translocase subunit SecB